MYHLPAETAEDTYFGAVSMHFENDTGELGWIISHFLAHCDTENIASYKVMEKLGMNKTGEWGGRRNRFASEDMDTDDYFRFPC